VIALYRAMFFFSYSLAILVQSPATPRHVKSDSSAASNA
jgi:hypothetical protein